MRVQSGLYYPYIHIRSDTWLKGAALYWNRVDRIVPHAYPTQDSLTARRLQDELGFIVGRTPGQAAIETSQYFIDLITERGSDLVDSLGAQPSHTLLARRQSRPKEDRLGGNGRVGYIYCEKMSPQLIEALADQGLAFGASDQDGEHRRLSMELNSANWIGMDSRLAATYMTVLARLTARHFDLNPVTDDPLAHTAMDGVSVDAIADALVGRPGHVASKRSSELRQRVATLAIETVIPRNLGLLDVGKIIAFRKTHESELSAFQMAVASAASELDDLAEDVNADALRDRVVEVTRRHLLGPRKDLHDSLKWFGLETVKSALTLQLPLSAGAGTVVGAVTAPVIGAATGAGIVITSFGVSEVSRRRDLRKKAAAANYLMELRPGLTSRGALQRRLRTVAN